MEEPSDISPSVEKLQIFAFYSVGSISLVIDLGTLAIQALFMCSMVASLGMVILARHQLLLPQDSILKIRTPMRYGTFCAAKMLEKDILFVSHIQLVLFRPVHTKLVLVQKPHLEWRERGLQWSIFVGDVSPIVWGLSYYGAFLFLPVGTVFILLPFLHILVIMLR
ncbi:hypothetical protein PMAYCL1PPCAC_09236, partial [Pristionchus mayeri]